MGSYARLGIAMLLVATSPANAQQKVEISGQSAKIKLSQVITGHLDELNGKFQLRVSEAATK